MTRLVLIIVALAALGVAVPSMASAATSVHDCRTVRGLMAPRSHPEYVGNVSVRNMSCDTALWAMFRGSLRNGNFSTRGFYCYRLQTWRARGTTGCRPPPC